MTESMTSRAAGAASSHAKKFGDHAKRTAEGEFNNGMNNMITKFIREITAKIFGK